MLPLKAGRDLQHDGRGVGRLRRGAAEEIVDRGGHATRGGQVGIAQRKTQRLELVQREIDLALDHAAIGDASDGGGRRGVILAASPSAWKPEIATGPCETA